MENKEVEIEKPIKTGEIKEEDYFSVNQEIFGGIRSAVERGEDLKKAMMTFYRAGYKKEEIEQAAKNYLEMQKSEEVSLPLKKKEEERIENKKEESKTISGSKRIKILEEKKDEEKKEGKEKTVGSLNSSGKIEDKKHKFKPLVAEKKGGLNSNQKVVQKVSDYSGGKPKPPGSNLITIILIISLIFLLGVLISIFLFREELVDVFNSLFG